MIFDPILDILRGRAITIPPLDGAFRANTALDDAPVFATLPDVDNLCLHRGRVLASSGAELYALAGDADPQTIETFPAPISALASSGEGLAVGLADGTLIENDTPVALHHSVACITALAYAPDGALWIANGSDRHGPGDWVRDLMEKNATGSVWRRAPGEGSEKMADNLAWPYGVLPDAAGATVSESWRHRLVRVEGGHATPTLRHLPGYPARLSPCADSGAWLTLFAPRNRLIELVLQETHYRYDMMASVPRAFWIAPAMSSGTSFLEPLQCGGIRVMGVHKPWAPSRSYGLAVRLDADMAPQYTLHSRANGRRHGTCSAIEAAGEVLVASRGGGVVVAPQEGEAS
jgi:hypothetical protein